jgi:hypothetical protein
MYQEKSGNPGKNGGLLFRKVHHRRRHPDDTGVGGKRVNVNVAVYQLK